MFDVLSGMDKEIVTQSRFAFARSLRCRHLRVVVAMTLGLGVGISTTLSWVASISLEDTTV